MHETAEDITALQGLLDRSYASAGRHLRNITTPERRVMADELVTRLNGMCLLVLATVSADGRPINGPVDGIFYRGAFHFGTGPDAVRLRHIRRNPRVSATHLPAEEFAVNVHGRAVETRHPGAGERGLPPDAARHLRAALRPRVGDVVPRQRPGLPAHRGRSDVHVRDA